MSDGQGSRSNGGIERGENMSDMRELIPELDLIPVERTSLIPAEEPKRVDLAPIRKRRNKAIRGIEIIAAVSLALNVIQSVIIYVLQAGPV